MNRLLAPTGMWGAALLVACTSPSEDEDPWGSTPTDTDTCAVGTSGCPCTYERECDPGLVCDEFVCWDSIVCGNAVVEGSEQCDDGNRESGDGCADDCTWEDMAVDISAGNEHTCAVLSGGRAKCWGNDAFSQLGSPGLVGLGDLLLPSEVDPIELGGSAVTLAAADRHTCALLADETVRCWGAGAEGQLGTGDVETVGDDEFPAAIAPVALGGWAKTIATGGSSTTHRSCATLGDGGLRCWGNGTIGYRLPGPYGDDETPAQLGDLDLPAIAAVAVAPFHLCALTIEDALRCWGQNGNGQLGYGDQDDTPGPFARLEDVPVGFTVAEVAAGTAHTCARSPAGMVRCWGDGSEGQLGYGSTEPVGHHETRLPLQVGDVALGAPAIQIVTGARYTCALLENRSVRCWGRLLGFPQRHRQCRARGCGADPACCIGDDEHPDEVDPIEIGGAVRKLSAGAEHTCALMESGAVRCWGVGIDGRLGYGGTETIGDDETPAAAGDVPL